PEPAVAPLEVGDRARKQVPDVDELAGLGIGSEAVVRKRVLPVEHAGDRLGTARERRMRGDVVHEVAFHPELALCAAKSLEKFFADDRGHLGARIGGKPGAVKAPLAPRVCYSWCPRRTR